jgi:hypothetical protein
MRDQSSDRRAAGVVGAENLPKEAPKGNQRREDPVVPAGLNLLHGLGNGFRRQDVGEWEWAFLKELLSKEVDLPMETSVPEVPHRSGSEPVMEFALLDLSQTAEIFLSHFPKTTCRKLRAIRLIDRDLIGPKRT